jgi:hypothetical protein
MNSIVPAISQGDTLKLEQPLDLPMNTPVMVQVFTDMEREDWLRFSSTGLERAYGENEPEYSEKDIIPYE